MPFMKNGYVDKSSNQLTVETAPLPPKRTFLLPLDKFSDHLAQLAVQVGSKAELGRRLNVSGQFIDLLIDGKRKPGPKILKAIGGRRVVMIEIDAGDK